MTEALAGGKLVLSSRRFLWIDALSAPLPGRSCWLPLDSVEQLETKASMAAKLQLKKDKIKLRVCVDHVRSPTAGTDRRKTLTLGLAFRDGIPQNFSEQLKDVLDDQKRNRQSNKKPAAVLHPDRPWDMPPEGIDGHHLDQLISMGFDRELSVTALREHKQLEEAVDWMVKAQLDPSLKRSVQAAHPPERHVISAGLGDIFKREEAKQRKRDQDLSEAFQDLESLMSKAKDMVQMAEQFYTRFSTDGRSEATSSTDQDTIDELISMGIPNPVTKASAGSLYSDQLCRQLADFLDEPLRIRGGMMTLPDVYCLYNRARGAAELVSPEELLQASKLFPKLKLPLRLRSFDSGVMVIQSAAHDESVVLQRIEAMVPQDDGLSRPLTALDVSREMQLPLSIAQEHLLMAEGKALLCRDDAPDGLRFYYNFFNSI